MVVDTARNWIDKYVRYLGSQVFGLAIPNVTNSRIGIEASAVLFTFHPPFSLLPLTPSTTWTFIIIIAKLRAQRNMFFGHFCLLPQSIDPCLGLRFYIAGIQSFTCTYIFWHPKNNGKETKILICSAFTLFLLTGFILIPISPIALLCLGRSIEKCRNEKKIYAKLVSPFGYSNK